MEFLRHGQRLIARGLLAGALGGLAGSAAKLAGELIYPPRTPGQEPPPAVLAEKLARHPLAKSQQALATQVFHWTFGAGIGAVYGVSAEVVPIVTLAYGVAFGEVVLLLTHESTLPMLGLDRPPARQPLREHASEALTHAMYGAATEAVRRWLMRRWRTRAAAAEAETMSAR